MNSLAEGENLYSGKFTGMSQTVQQHFDTATDLWHNEDQWWTHGDVAGGQAGGSQSDRPNQLRPSTGQGAQIIEESMKEFDETLGESQPRMSTSKGHRASKKGTRNEKGPMP